MKIKINKKNSKNIKSRILFFIVSIIMCTMTVGCTKKKDEAVDAITFVYNFNETSDGFIGNKTDVPITYSDNDYEYKYNLEEIEMKGTKNKALSLEFNNKNKDMFAYVFREFNDKDGVEKNTTYDAEIKFDIATNIQDEKKGEKTYIKTGIVGRLPLPNENTNDITFNLDKGNGKEEGKELKTLEGITKPNKEDKQYEFKTYREKMSVTSNKNGSIYLVIGLDSELGGKQKIYIDNVEVKLTKKKVDNDKEKIKNNDKANDSK